MKVLIVDDIPFMLTSLRQILERNRYEVVSATDGKQALGHLTTDFMIDAVITDLVMPVMSGLQLFKHAQQIERFNDEGVIPPPPFVLLTSFDEGAPSSAVATEYRIAQKCLLATLQKPVVEADLIPLLESIEHRQTTHGRDAAGLRDLLQQSLDRLGQIRSPGEIHAVIQQLQKRLIALQANA